MFLALSKLLCFLVYPLSATILLLIVSWSIRNRSPERAWRLCGVALGLLYALSIQPVADLLLLPLERPFESLAEPERAGAIVVLGGFTDIRRSTPERVELTDASDRLIEAVLLARKWPGSLLVFSAKREAPLSGPLAVKLGVSEGRIQMDTSARNTYENAVGAKGILERERVSEFVLVTSAVHMKRALACFRKAGLEPIPHPVDFRNHFGQYDVRSVIPQNGPLMCSTRALKEYVGFVVYRIKGYL